MKKLRPCCSSWNTAILVFAAVLAVALFLDLTWVMVSALIVKAVFGL